MDKALIIFVQPFSLDHKLYYKNGQETTELGSYSIDTLLGALLIACEDYETYNVKLTGNPSYCQFIVDGFKNENQNLYSIDKINSINFEVI